MWPWRTSVQVVLAASAGDDATAALTMILRYHRRPVTFDEVRQAIYQGGGDAPRALDVIDAAEHFRLRGQGLGLDGPRQLAKLPTPSIAHVMAARGPFPRPVGERIAGYFAVVVAVSSDRVRWIDPFAGERDHAHAEFLAHASGIFLVFDEGEPLPRARTRPARA